MAKKKQEKNTKDNNSENETSGKSSFINSFMPVIKDLFSNLVFNKITDMYKQTVKSIQDSIYHTTKKVIESAMAGVLMLLGICFVTIALPFFLSAYLDFPPSIFFIIIGLLLIIISMLMFKDISKNKYNNI